VTTTESGQVATRRRAGDAAITVVDLTLSSAARHIINGAASAAERSRAASFVSDELGQRWLTTQHATRSIVAQHMSVPMSAIQIASDSAGQPFVAGTDCNISISKSGNWAAVAVASSAIGIDIELAKPLPEAAMLARRFLHANDTAMIEAAHDPEAAFYRAWVRLEAVLKRRGTGFDGTAPPSVLAQAAPDIVDLDLSTVDRDCRLVGAFSADVQTMDQAAHHRQITLGDEVFPILVRVQTVNEVLGIAD